MHGVRNSRAANHRAKTSKMLSPTFAKRLTSFRPGARSGVSHVIGQVWGVLSFAVSHAVSNDSQT